MSVSPKILFLFFSLLIFSKLNAQSDFSESLSLGPEDGLSQSTVRCILQDKTGFIWVGTNDGLNRYDARKFKIYRPGTAENSLPGKQILALSESPDGKIWVATEAGICAYSPVTDRFKRYKFKDAPDFRPQTVVAEADGTVWAGGNFLCKISPGSSEVGILELPDSLQISALFPDNFGRLWIGTDKGLYRLEKKTGKTERLIADLPVRTLAADSEGKLWVGGTAGVHVLSLSDSAEKRTVLPVSVSVNFILTEKNGEIWFGTNSGLIISDQKNNRIRYVSKNTGILNTLNDDFVHCIYRDRAGIIWVGTRAGLNKIRPDAKPFRTYRYIPMSGSSLSDDEVTSFLEDRDGNIWVGTKDGGLNKHDSITDEFLHFLPDTDVGEGPAHRTVWALTEDSEGIIWVGTSAGLSRLDKKTAEFQHFTFGTTKNDNPVTALFEDAQGRLWVGTYKTGLLLLTDKKTGAFRTFDRLSHNYVRVISESSEGKLLIGTQGGGLNIFDPKTEKFTVFRHQTDRPDSPASDYIWCISEDPDGNIWLGTSDGLSVSRGKTGKFRTYRAAEGLPDPTIYGIVRSGKYVWLSTNRGLSRFDASRKIFRNFDVRDGLQGNEFNGGASLKSRDGRLFFGGKNGFNVFRPAQITDNPEAPPVVITSIKIMQNIFESDTQAVYKKELNLLPDQNFISLEFAALNFHSPEKNKFFYKLEGLDNEWIDSENRTFVNYANLSPGVYVFRLKAANNDGIINEEGSRLIIRIQAAFWQTYWFKSLIFAGLLLLFYRPLRRAYLQRKPLPVVLPLSVAEEVLTQSPAGFFTAEAGNGKLEKADENFYLIAGSTNAELRFLDDLDRQIMGILRSEFELKGLRITLSDGREIIFSARRKGKRIYGFIQ